MQGYMRTISTIRPIYIRRFALQPCRLDFNGTLDGCDGLIIWHLQNPFKRFGRVRTIEDHVEPHGLVNKIEAAIADCEGLSIVDGPFCLQERSSLKIGQLVGVWLKLDSERTRFGSWAIPGGCQIIATPVFEHWKNRVQHDISVCDSWL